MPSPQSFEMPTTGGPELDLKELANRFICAQQANWRNLDDSWRSYRDWLGRFLRDHPEMKAAEFNVEAFAAWKLSLRQRDFAPCSINHYLNAVRAMFRFAEDADLLTQVPRLGRVKNDHIERAILVTEFS